MRLYMQRKDMVMKRGRESLYASCVYYGDGVCKRHNKERSVSCNEGDFELTAHESRQAKESLREERQERQPSQRARPCAGEVCACLSD